MNHDMLEQIDRAVRVYCDGSCLLHHPARPGGWAFIAQHGGKVLANSAGGSFQTTNNQMELTAAIEGLSFCRSIGHKDVLLVADSKYVVNGISAWLKGWVKRGWKTADGSQVANREHWQQMASLVADLNVRAVWVKGHAGHEMNEMVDAAALAMAKEMAVRAESKNG